MSSQPRSSPAPSARGSGRRSRPTKRLQQLYHPWTSYLIVPLFALANAGIAIDRGFLAEGLHLAHHARNPLRLRHRQAGRHPRRFVAADAAEPRAAAAAGRLGGVAGGGTIAGIGAVSRCCRRTCVRGAAARGGKARHPQRRSARRFSAWLLFRATALLPAPARSARLLGTAEPLVDLIEVDPERDHIRGPIDAPVTVVEYGDFQCPYCGLAEPVVRELLREFGDVRYVWRHLPLNDVTPMPSLPRRPPRPPPTRSLLGDARPPARPQDAPRPSDLIAYAAQLGLDVERFANDLRGTPAPPASRMMSTAPTSAASRARRLLHQRPTPLRRLRASPPLGGCARSGRARAALATA